MSIDDDAVREVLERYGISENAVVTRVSVGLVNTTMFVDDGSERFVLQRLHPIFRPEVNLDVEAVTAHLARKGMTTPRLVRTNDGAAWVETSGGIYRMLTFVPGRSIERIENPAQAYAAAVLCASFHRAVSDFTASFHFQRTGVHDSTRHFDRLRGAAAAHPSHVGTELAGEILAASAELPPCPDQPLRVVHGDLKISNVLFNSTLSSAVALVDLDTMTRATLAVELGDALRSWCNPRGEDDAQATFSLDVFRAAIAGYRSVFALEPEEATSIVSGTETIALELASRFCLDVFEDRYFGWSPDRFASRAEHNLVRARSQLSLTHSVRAQRDELLEIVSDH